MTDRRIIDAATAALRAGILPSKDKPALIEALARSVINAADAAKSQIASLDEPTRFVVKGRGTFPADMLRHDRCWPVDGDLNRVTDSTVRLGERKDVTVVMCAQSARGITPLRWKSFGWTVTEVGGVEVDWSSGRPMY